ncbi:MAG TPA: ABC transporter ATP-binding protein [Desulfomonilaceae bacterium]|nr:ABC transporter ATP-binding protein [Desulfomonilaceae bacterium]
MTTAYSLTNIEYSYGGPPAIEIGALEVAQGEIVALVGPNGSGKTTLLHVLAFLEIPQIGEIRFFGEEFRKGNLLTLRRKVGLLLQNPYLFHETVLANVAWGLRLRGVSGQKAQNMASQALELVGLSGFGDRYARSLSGGESQRVALARALVLDPAVLLLDEPSNHMDRESAERTEALVEKLNKEQGKTVIMATHAVDSAQSLAHRVIHLRQGRVFRAAPDNLFRGVLKEQGAIFSTGKIEVRLEAPAVEGDFICIDPSSIDILLKGPQLEVMNVFRGTVVGLSAENGRIRVEVDAGERFRVTISSDWDPASQLSLGSEVFLVPKPDGISLC